MLAGQRNGWALVERHCIAGSKSPVRMGPSVCGRYSAKGGPGQHGSVFSAEIGIKLLGQFTLNLQPVSNTLHHFHSGHGPGLNVLHCL